MTSVNANEKSRQPGKKVEPPSSRKPDTSTVRLEKAKKAVVDTIDAASWKVKASPPEKPWNESLVEGAVNNLQSLGRTVARSIQGDPIRRTPLEPGRGLEEIRKYAANPAQYLRDNYQPFSKSAAEGKGLLRQVQTGPDNGTFLRVPIDLYDQVHDDFKAGKAGSFRDIHSANGGEQLLMVDRDAQGKVRLVELKRPGTYEGPSISYSIKESPDRFLARGPEEVTASLTFGTPDLAHLTLSNTRLTSSLRPAEATVRLGFDPNKFKPDSVNLRTQRTFVHEAARSGAELVFSDSINYRNADNPSDIGVRTSISASAYLIAGSRNRFEYAALGKDNSGVRDVVQAGLLEAGGSFKLPSVGVKNFKDDKLSFEASFNGYFEAQAYLRFALSGAGIRPTPLTFAGIDPALQLTLTGPLAERVDPLHNGLQIGEQIRRLLSGDAPPAVTSPPPAATAPKAPDVNAPPAADKRFLRFLPYTPINGGSVVQARINDKTDFQHGSSVWQVVVANNRHDSNGAGAVYRPVNHGVEVSDFANKSTAVLRKYVPYYRSHDPASAQEFRVAVQRLYLSAQKPDQLALLPSPESKDGKRFLSVDIKGREAELAKDILALTNPHGMYFGIPELARRSTREFGTKLRGSFDELRALHSNTLPSEDFGTAGVQEAARNGGTYFDDAEGFYCALERSVQSLQTANQLQTESAAPVFKGPAT